MHHNAASVLIICFLFRYMGNCWARNLRITNSDYGLQIAASDFCTVENVIIDTDFNR